MKRLIASLSAWIVAAACGAAHPPKPVANEATATPNYQENVTAEWSVTNEGSTVTLAVRIYDQRVALGTYLGRVFPAWQSYCDVKMGYLPARNVEYAKTKGAIAKLTVVGDGDAPFEEPTPAGSTTFFLKRPSPNRLEVWKQETRLAVVPVWPNARFDEEIDDDDALPGFNCGGDDGMNL